jgi:hypothetical protein
MSLCNISPRKFAAPLQSDDIGHVVTYAASRRPLTAEAGVNSQPILYELCAKKLALGQVYLRAYLFSPESIILKMLYSLILFICYR